MIQDMSGVPCANKTPVQGWQDSNIWSPSSFIMTGQFDRHKHNWRTYCGVGLFFQKEYSQPDTSQGKLFVGAENNYIGP